jgi:predicted anti-sigma-YlaC factor YlaD
MLCRLVDNQLVHYHNGEVGRLAGWMVERHLQVCSRCRASSGKYLRTIRLLRASMPACRYGPPPPGSWERLKEQLPSKPPRLKQRAWLRPVAASCVLLGLAGFWLFAGLHRSGESGARHVKPLFPGTALSRVPGHVGVVDMVDTASRTATVLAQPGLTLTNGDRLQVLLPTDQPDAATVMQQFDLTVAGAEGEGRYRCSIDLHAGQEEAATLSVIKPGLAVIQR